MHNYLFNLKPLIIIIIIPNVQEQHCMQRVSFAVMNSKYNQLDFPTEHSLSGLLDHWSSFTDKICNYTGPYAQ